MERRWREVGIHTKFIESGPISLGSSLWYTSSSLDEQDPSKCDKFEMVQCDKENIVISCFDLTDYDDMQYYHTLLKCSNQLFILDWNDCNIWRFERDTILTKVHHYEPGNVSFPICFTYNDMIYIVSDGECIVYSPVTNTSKQATYTAVSTRPGCDYMGHHNGNLFFGRFGFDWQDLCRVRAENISDDNCKYEVLGHSRRVMNKFISIQYDKFIIKFGDCSSCRVCSHSIYIMDISLDKSVWMRLFIQCPFKFVSGAVLLDECLYVFPSEHIRGIQKKAGCIPMTELIKEYFKYDCNNKKRGRSEGESIQEPPTKRQRMNGLQTLSFLHILINPKIWGFKNSTTRTYQWKAALCSGTGY